MADTPRTLLERPSRRLARRQMLQRCSLGFGSLALADLLTREAQGGKPEGLSGLHFPAKAKRIIFLFMHGGPSHVDTFDYKPELQSRDGEPLPIEKPTVQFSSTGKLLASPWSFRQHGECGAWVSELFPHVAGAVDDICFLKSVHGTNAAHGGALLSLHTGTDTFVRPSLGSWLVYGLGSENENLPGFITICPTYGHGGVNNWSSAFLPARYQGIPLGKANSPADQVTIRNLQPSLSRSRQRRQLDFLQALNTEQLSDNGRDAALEARIESFELAFRMQTETPELLNVESETAATRHLYGLDDARTSHFARQCVLARRCVEKGVRFVQCTHSYKWDQHGGLRQRLPRNAAEVDKPIAGLLTDLKSRGLLDDTLVLWGGEFGRTPTAQGDRNGRDHNPEGFTMWMAGAGVKPGFSYGETDPWGYYSSVDKLHVHDLHATILHLMGIDHEKLTYRFAGRDFRLTDVAGRVAKQILS
jgi:hypothetical protein